MDRAGFAGDDGRTHHGIYDLTYLRPLPNMSIMAPKDENELRHMLFTAISHEEGPVAVRYPRGSGIGVDTTGAPPRRFHSGAARRCVKAATSP